MANDVKMQWNNDTLQADVVLARGDLVREEGFETAVLMSLFTDARVDEDELIENGITDLTDRRGWWADQYSEYDNDIMGSKLWLLKRAKTTEQTLTKCHEYSYEAVEWFIIDGVATKIIVEVERLGIVGNDMLAFKVQIFKDNSTAQALEYNIVWDKQFDSVEVI